MASRFLPLFLILPLVACDSASDARYLIDTPPPGPARPLAVTSVELRDVTLPGHATGSDILVREADGGLRPLDGADWADDPERAVTATLARALDLGSTATVIAEPWPLRDGPAARLELRMDRMLARADGRFELGGQAALVADRGRIRDRVERFDIEVPLADLSAPAVTDAAGRALGQLADELIALLAR